MILIDQGDGCVVAVPVRWRDRLAARLHADRIDLDLARGESPDVDVRSALRARALTSGRTRAVLARGLRRSVVQATAPPVAGMAGTPQGRQRLVGAADDIEQLRRGLLADGPVSARGAAQAYILLTTVLPILSRRRDGDALAEMVRRATDALSILGDEPRASLASPS
jgi:hypothetical protein